MQVDFKQKQQQRDERFRNSLFQESSISVSTDSEPTQLSNQSYVQIFIKCFISPDIVVEKSSFRQNYLDNTDDEIEIILDEVIENQQTGIKKEFNVFVQRDLVKQIKLLQQNYIEKQDLIKMPVCGANGIRLPEESDFQLYFKLFQMKADPIKSQILAQEQDLKSLFGLLICSCIFTDEQIQTIAFKQITKKPTIEILFKLLLVTSQYESEIYTLQVYKLVRQLFYFQAGLLAEIQDPILKDTFQNRINETYEVLKPNLIKLKLKEYIITINTTFLYPIYKKYETEKNEYLKPLDSNQKFQVVRNADIQDELELNSFPHIYQIRNEQTQAVHLIAIQQESHSEILIYRVLSDKCTKYNENYVGCIKRNVLGTTFKIVDDGYSKKQSAYFPEWIGSERKNFLNIEYETNIMASQPRKFDIVFYNFLLKTYEQLITLQPKYNPERDCYQLHFYGRAKIPSARNFQMIRPGDESTIYLLHGKVERSVFNVDFRPPLNVIQAFCISLVSISSKLCVS